jgi:hypothetical protein
VGHGKCVRADPRTEEPALTIARSAIGATENWAQSAAYWNLALDDKGGPILGGTSSCKGGCRGMVTVNGNGDVTFNQECAWYSSPLGHHPADGLLVLALAQGSVAIAPKDVGGPMGQRIGVSIAGNQAGHLRVSAAVTGRLSKSDWSR